MILDKTFQDFMFLRGLGRNSVVSAQGFDMKMWTAFQKHSLFVCIKALVGNRIEICKYLLSERTEILELSKTQEP